VAVVALTLVAQAASVAAAKAATLLLLIPAKTEQLTLAVAAEVLPIAAGAIQQAQVEVVLS